MYFYEPKGKRCVLTTGRASSPFSVAAGDSHVNAEHQVGRNAILYLYLWLHVRRKIRMGSVFFPLCA